MTLMDEVHGALMDHLHLLWSYKKLRPAGPAGERSDRRLLEMRMALRQARRFSLDRQMAEAMVRASYVDPARMLQRISLARLPAPTVWMEYDCGVVVETGRTMGRVLGSSVSDEPAAGQRGLLFMQVPGRDDLWDAYTFASMDDLVLDGVRGGRTGVYLSPLKMSLCTDPNSKWVRTMSGLSDHELDRLAWGTLEGVGPDLSRSLYARGMFLPDDVVTEPHLEAWYRAQHGQRPSDPHLIVGLKSLTRLEARERAGDLRLTVTALAMLNNTPIEYQPVQTAGRFTARMHHLSYLDHHIIRVKCGRARVMRVVERSLREGERHVRWHEVRGHWVHRRVASPCQECARKEWLDDGPRWVALDARSQRCQACGTTRSWREYPHGRGDPSLGATDTEYRVTRRPGQD